MPANSALSFLSRQLGDRRHPDGQNCDRRPAPQSPAPTLVGVVVGGIALAAVGHLLVAVVAFAAAGVIGQGCVGGFAHLALVAVVDGGAAVACDGRGYMKATTKEF